MSMARFIKPPREARIAAAFVERFLMDISARDFFAAPELAETVRLAQEGDWAAAARAFRQEYDCDIPLSVCAAEIAATLQ